MDAQDFSILATLFRSPRAAYDEVGRRVGLTGNAVRARLARLREEGVLQGFALAPAPGLLGLQDGLLTFTDVEDAAGREDDLLKALSELPGVRSVDVAVDDAVHLRVSFRDESDWDRIERAAISLVGKPPAHRFRDHAEEIPLAPPERRVVEALLPDGRRPLKDIAEAAGLSLKTARRRLESLLGDGRVRIEPVLSPTEARGAVPSSAHLLLREGASPESLARELPEGVVLTGAPHGRLQVVHAFHGSVRDARAGAQRLAHLPGVEHVAFSLAARRPGAAWLPDATRPEQPVPAPATPVPLVRTRG